MKKCSHCKEIKTIEFFANDKHKLDGKNHRCRECQGKLSSASYKKHKDKESNVDKRFRYGVNKAKYKQINWSITYDQYLKIISSNCHYCNKDISKEIGVGLDRLNNSIGYEQQNVVACCGDCNKSRADRFSYEEWKIAMSAIIEYRKKLL